MGWGPSHHFVLGVVNQLIALEIQLSLYKKTESNLVADKESLPIGPGSSELFTCHYYVRQPTFALYNPWLQVKFVHADKLRLFMDQGNISFFYC